VPAIVERADREHPYDVPCVIALPVVAGNPPDIDWVLSETTDPTAKAVRTVYWVKILEHAAEARSHQPKSPRFKGMARWPSPMSSGDCTRRRHIAAMGSAVPWLRDVAGAGPLEVDDPDGLVGGHPRSDRDTKRDCVAG
jgi:hypothetical protein